MKTVSVRQAGAILAVIALVASTTGCAQTLSGKWYQQAQVTIAAQDALITAKRLDKIDDKRFLELNALLKQSEEWLLEANKRIDGEEMEVGVAESDLANAIKSLESFRRLYYMSTQRQLPGSE